MKYAIDVDNNHCNKLIRFCIDNQIEFIYADKDNQIRLAFYNRAAARKVQLYYHSFISVYAVTDTEVFGDTISIGKKGIVA
jgi:pyoverdine/dityrosine biosynthesis protein Dit1